MTISTTQHSITYIGNGITCDFPIPFLFFEASDIHLSLQTPQELPVSCEPSAYQITGMHAPQGGSVRFYLPPAEGQNIHIMRYVQPLQQTAWKNHERIDAPVLEQQFDRLVMGLQQLAPALSRGLQVAIEGKEPLPVLQSPSGQAGKVLLVDESERNITYYDPRAVTTAGLYHKEVFSCDGIRCVFQLTHPAASANSLLVVLKHQVQEPGVDYVLSGQAMTFMHAPEAGIRNLYVINLADTLHVTEISDGSITAEKLAEGCVLPNPELRQFSQTVQALSVTDGKGVIGLQQGSVWTLTLTQDTTITLSAPEGSGRNYGCKLLLTTGDRPYNLSWGTQIKWPYGRPPAFKGLMETHLLSIETFDGGKSWYAALVMEALQ